MHDYRNIIVHHQDIKGAKGLYMGGKQSVSAEGFEPSTNGLKSQSLSSASPIQWPANFHLVHWTASKASTLDAYFKVCQQLHVQWTWFQWIGWQPFEHTGRNDFTSV
jgi:hypothetical protein